ncbi:MAG TPA: methyltransferase domain-containing protein [Sulfurospirillum arcachonense]|nr:methyltransferase domain-containing protein [Sulfurospirillum arcachonense]HIP45855.1 methyltransferase domain-containing protein [Sulfurospirillum arcachonense]
MPTDKTLYLFQHEEGYKYNSDSLVLYDFISKLNPKGRVLDVGSGSGIVGLLLKKDFTKIALTQIDIQPLHVELTCKSAKKNALDSEVLHVDIRECKFEDKFDFIVTNPPYYHEGSQKSENDALVVSRYADVLPFSELCRAVSTNIKPRGSFVFCYDAKQIDVLLSELLKNKFKVNHMRFVHTKQSKDSSLVLIHAKKSSKSLCKILPPVYMDSKEVEEIYKNTKTQSLLC